MPRLHHLLLRRRRRRRRRRSQKRARRRRRWSYTPFTMPLPPGRPPPSVDVPLKRRLPPRRRRRPIVDPHLDVVNEILSHPPISALVCLRADSMSFRPSIRSFPGPFCRDPFFFVFYCLHARRAAVYQPYRDRWRLQFVPPFPTAASGSKLVVTYSSLFDPSSRPLHSSSMTDVFLYDPFTGATTIIPPQECSHGVALVFSHNDNYKLVTVTNFPAYLLVYDSHQTDWTHRLLHPNFNYIVNAVPLDGFLYVLCFWPDDVVRFNLEILDWERCNAPMPSEFCVHLAVFNDTLFLVGGLQQGLAIVGVAIWELVQGEIMEWRWVASMPDELSRDFIQVRELRNFRVCSGVGFICFYHLITHRMVMCDVVGWRWRLARDCPVPIMHRDVWLGCVVEPSTNLLPAPVISPPVESN